MDVMFVNLLLLLLLLLHLLLLLRSYQTGYWRADKARMSNVSPEKSPVYNGGSLLTPPREADRGCVRRGPGGGGWVGGGLGSSERGNGDRRYCGGEWAYTCEIYRWMCFLD